MRYDYIIIGAGSSGCAVASRLSENPDVQVLLIEAGGPDEQQEIHVPATFPHLFKSSLDWAYETEPQRHCNDRREYMPRGKVLGGSSSINAMIYQRGHPSDYDGWAALGNQGWAWDDLLPYFKRVENFQHGASNYHGIGGPIDVAELCDPTPLSQAFVTACQQQGLPLNNDFNAADQEGFGLYQVTQRNGQRCSAAVGYLRPALERVNLTALTHAQVLRLKFDGKRCHGAVYRKDGSEQFVQANREVIVCGGAINSPQLLMLSGIGPKAALRTLGIDVIHDLPGVGQNLQDHLMVPVAYHCTQPISLAAADSEEELAKFQEVGKGMLTSNIGEAGGFLRLQADPHQAPELQFHFVPGWFVFHGFNNPEGHGVTLLPSLVGTKSIGQLTLRSADPDQAPAIDPNFLAEPLDMDVLVEGVKLARRIFAASAFSQYRGDEYLPGPNVKTDDQIRGFIRAQVQSIYHPVGTCKMGNDAMAVVNHRLQVHGIEGLRVADASIMPRIINANTNVPCMMIGEKCADLLSS